MRAMMPMACEPKCGGSDREAVLMNARGAMRRKLRRWRCTPWRVLPHLEMLYQQILPSGIRGGIRGDG